MIIHASQRVFMNAESARPILPQYLIVWSGFVDQYENVILNTATPKRLFKERNLLCGTANSAPKLAWSDSIRSRYARQPYKVEAGRDNQKHFQASLWKPTRAARDRTEELFRSQEKAEFGCEGELQASERREITLQQIPAFILWPRLIQSAVQLTERDETS